MTTTTATATINVLRAVFTRYGLPHEVVSDNGPQFVSEEYQTFLKMNRVKLTLVPPYHPASNGLAERHVQTFKGMYKAYGNTRSVQHRVADILFRYRNTPHSTTGKTPAELFLKREPRTFLSLVKPSLKSRVESRQAASKLYKDGAHPKLRTFDLYQPVRVKNVRGGKEKWIQGTIVAIKGPETYIVRVSGNNRRFVHANHLIPNDAREQNAKKENIEREIVECNPTPLLQEIPVMPQAETSSKSAQVPSVGTELAEVPSVVVQINSDPDTSKIPVSNPHFVGTSVKVTRSGRVSKPPERLNL